MKELIKKGCENVKTFAKKHKKLLCIGGTVAGGLVVGKWIFGRGTDVKEFTVPVSIPDGVDLPIPEMEVGTVTDLWRADCGCTEAIVSGLTVADIGKLGEGLAKAVDGITDDTLVSAVVSMCNEVEP